MRLKGKRAAILVENLYQDQEVWYPLFRLKEEGADVVVVGSGSAKTYTSKHGYPVDADKAASEVKAQDFDAVIIPGGYAPDRMRRHPAMVSLVRKAALNHKVVAAICHAGWMLASAEVIRGKDVTGCYAIKDDLVHAGANWMNENAIVLRTVNCITSSPVPAMPLSPKTIDKYAPFSL